MAFVVIRHNNGGISTQTVAQNYNPKVSHKKFQPKQAVQNFNPKIVL
jgi:hypothetical protein